MTIRWGIIGCGDVTERKSGPAFQKVENSKLVAVMRRDGVLAADYARRHGVPKSYDDADKLIGDPEVDAVYIATPPGEHLNYALRVCAAGKPAYVEKPMARNFAECQRMFEAFAAAKVPLFVAYYRRALPRFLKARELVYLGQLGQVTGVSCRFAGPLHHGLDAKALPWRVDAERAGGGHFLDMGCHTLDVLDFILGPLGQVRGQAANVASPYPVEDAVVMRFGTDSGALGTAQWNFASAIGADEIVISGDKAELRMSTFGDDPVVLHTPDGVERFDLPNPEHIQQPLIKTIVDQLSGNGRCESTGISASRTSAVMDAVLVGYYGTRDNGFWEKPSEWPGRRV
jgi:1,5-anhydro-D-fructose reductase (1,5-anhydro-D-mannitol-forming)